MLMNKIVYVAIVAVCASNFECDCQCVCGPDGNNGELGQWTIHFGFGHAISDSRGNPCDFFQQCDPYLVVKVNGEQVWKGQTHWSQSELSFDETLTLQLDRYSNIEIEMWDDDPGNGDDLMSDWMGTVETLSRQKQLHGHDWGSGNQNRVSIRTEWKPITQYNNNSNNRNYNNNNPNYNNNNPNYNNNNPNYRNNNNRNVG